MDRLDFFKEMKASLLKTAVSIFEPILEEEIETIHHVSEQTLGIRWYFLTDSVSESMKIVQKRINKQPVIIVQNGKQLKAFSGICNVCSQLLLISAVNESCKCLTCEKEVSFNDPVCKNNEMLREYPVKKKKDGYYAALKNKTQDDGYA